MTIRHYLYSGQYRTPHRESNRLQGFVWEAKEGEVAQAQSSLDELQRQNDLEAQIAALEAYKKLWEDTIQSYQDGIDQQITAGLLGQNWEQDILNQRTDNIQAFGQDYATVCDQLRDDIEGSVAHQLLQLNTLIEKWSSAIDDITYNIDQYEGALEFLSEFEASNYTQRLDMLTNFVSDSISQLDRLKNAQNTLLETSNVADANIGGSNRGSVQGVGSNAGLTYDKDTIYADIISAYEEQGADLEVIAIMEAKRNLKIDDMGLDYEKTYKYQQYLRPYGSYDKGGVVDYTGMAQVHGSTAKPEVVFNANDASKLYDVVHTTEDLGKELREGAAEIKSATGSIYKLVEQSELFKGALSFDSLNNTPLFDTYEKMMKNSLQSFSNITNNQINKMQPITVEFNGDMSFPNVTNGEGLAEEIINTLNSKIIQLKYKS